MSTAFKQQAEIHVPGISAADDTMIDGWVEGGCTAIDTRLQPSCAWTGRAGQGSRLVVLLGCLRNLGPGMLLSSGM